VLERTISGDAVGILMNEVQDAAALMMDVKSAFPSVAKECLVKKMREMRFDKNLVGCVKIYTLGIVYFLVLLYFLY
jgi:hypothetical protein